MEHFSTNKATGLYSLGVDAGGSKTYALIVDAQGRELGSGIAGSANYAAVGLENALQSIYTSVKQAVQAAGCSLPLPRAWLGVAGLDRSEDYDILFPHLRALADVVRLTNDAELLLSALTDAVGVALIAGTGSIALGRNAADVNARAGGWGHAIGDEGSGYDIGRRALQAVARAEDGRGEQTLLLDLILQHWHLDKADAIIGQIYPDDDKAMIARLSTCVFVAARQGDEVARMIIQQAADELALAASTVGAKLFPDTPIPLALSGGLLVYEHDYRAQVLQSLHQKHATGQVVVVELPALSAARAATNLA